MTIAAFNEALDNLRAISIRTYDSDGPRRRALHECANDLENAQATFLTGLGRIAIGSKTMLSQPDLTVDQAKLALAKCIELAETAMGIGVTAKNDG